MSKTNILIMGNDWARMNDLLFFAENLLKQNPNYDITFLLKGKSYLQRFPKCKQFKYIFSKGKLKLSGSNHRPSILEKIVTRLLGELKAFTMKRLTNSSLTELFVYFYKIKLHQIEYQHAVELSNKKYNFATVLCHADIAQECGLAYFKGFQDNNIPVINIILLNPGPAGMVMSRKNIPYFQKSITSPLILRYIMWKYPQQVFKFEGNKYLYHRSGSVLALDKLAMLTNKPFVNGTGFSDYVCADSNYDLQMRKQYGVATNKLKLVGDYSLDLNWLTYSNKSKRKKEIIKKYNLNSNKKIIIVALPQMAEHGYLEWQQHYQYIENILHSVCSVDTNLLISLHPKMKLENYIELQTKFNCNILDERLFDVLAIADIYLSKPSSTIRWGVMCDINVIMYDFWGFDLSSYTYMESVDVVTDLKELTKKIQLRMVADQDKVSTFNNLSRDELFDGNTMKRYANLINETSKNRY